MGKASFLLRIFSVELNKSSRFNRYLTRPLSLTCLERLSVEEFQGSKRIFERIGEVLSKEGKISIMRLRFLMNLIEKEFPRLSAEEEYSQLRISRVLMEMNFGIP